MTKNEKAVKKNWKAYQERVIDRLVRASKGEEVALKPKKKKACYEGYGGGMKTTNSGR